MTTVLFFVPPSSVKLFFLTTVQVFLFLSISCALVVFWAPVHDGRLEPIREERLLSTQSNICSALNWANTDKTNTISSSVCGFLPCCPFLSTPPVQRCCTTDHCLIRHMPRTRWLQASHWLRDKSDPVRCCWFVSSSSPSCPAALQQILCLCCCWFRGSFL